MNQIFNSLVTPHVLPKYLCAPIQVAAMSYIVIVLIARPGNVLKAVRNVRLAPTPGLSIMLISPVPVNGIDPTRYEFIVVHGQNKVERATAKGSTRAAMLEALRKMFGRGFDDTKFIGFASVLSEDSKSVRKQHLCS